MRRGDSHSNDPIPNKQQITTPFNSPARQLTDGHWVQIYCGGNVAVMAQGFNGISQLGQVQLTNKLSLRPGTGPVAPLITMTMEVGEPAQLNKNSKHPVSTIPFLKKRNTSNRIRPSILSFFIAIVIIIGGSQTKAQTPVKIGDAVPEITFRHLLNYKDSTARLSDFRGKLVILDFWASWCSSCINHLPDAEALQKMFGNKIQFVLVNSYTSHETPEKIGAFIEKWESNHTKLTVPIARADTAAKQTFPSRFLPHYIWIDEKGIFRAASSHHEVTEANISKALDGYYAMPFKEQ